MGHIFASRLYGNNCRTTNKRFEITMLAFVFAADRDEEAVPGTSRSDTDESPKETESAEKEKEEGPQRAPEVSTD